MTKPVYIRFYADYAAPEINVETLPHDAFQSCVPAAEPCVYVVVARHNKRVVGLLRGKVKNDTFYSWGTWVSRPYRRQGIAFRMWRLMIRRLKVKRVKITTVTDRGMTLALRLQSLPATFAIDDQGERKLRDLRNTKRRRA